MPIRKPAKTYAQESPENRRFLDECLDRFFEWVRTEGNLDGKTVLRSMGVQASRQELIDMFDEGVIAITEIGDALALIFYDDEKGKYLPFGPALHKLRSASEMN